MTPRERVAEEAAKRNGKPHSGPTGVPKPTTSPGWPDPIPLRSDPDVPEFPVETLTPWLKKWATACAIEKQVPDDLSGIAALVIVSAGIGRKVAVEPREGWIEPTNLFGFIGLPPGERKSQTFRAAMSPIKGLEKWLQDQAKPRIAEAESCHRVASKRVEHLEGNLAKAKPNERLRIEDDLRVAVRELERIVVPVLPVLQVADETPESLGRELIRQEGRLLAASPEAAALGNIVRDKKAIIDVFLSGHAGDDYQVGRIGRGREGVDRAALSCIYSPQPTVLEGLAETPELRGRGFLARWLYSLPRPRVGYREIGAPAMPESVRCRYADLLTKIWMTKYADEEKQTPHLLQLTDRAKATLTAFENWIEPELRADGQLGQMAGWGNKLAGMAVRLAGVLHAAGGIENGAYWLAEPIAEDTVSRAITIARYAIGHAKAVFDLMGTSETVTLARRVMKWIEHNALNGQFTKRDAHRGTRPAFETADDIDPILGLLERHYLIRQAAADPKEGAGRKPSGKFEVNPAAFNDEPVAGHNGQNGHNPPSAPAEGHSVHSGHSVPVHTSPNTNPEPAPEPEPQPETSPPPAKPKRYGNKPNRGDAK